MDRRGGDHVPPAKEPKRVTSIPDDDPRNHRRGGWKLGARVDGGTSVGTGTSGRTTCGVGTMVEATDANFGAVSLLTDHPRYRGAQGVRPRVRRDVGQQDCPDYLNGADAEDHLSGSHRRLTRTAVNLQRHHNPLISVSQLP